MLVSLDKRYHFKITILHAPVCVDVLGNTVPNTKISIAPTMMFFNIDQIKILTPEIKWLYIFVVAMGHGQGLWRGGLVEGLKWRPIKAIIRQCKKKTGLIMNDKRKIFLIYLLLA